MAKHGEEMNEDTQKFFSIPVKRRREMENQMDAILSSFEQ